MADCVDEKAPAPDAPVELTARVVADGNRYVAAVDGLEQLEGAGRTPDAARKSLVQAMRGWLERMDTSSSLPDAFGRDDLDETAEIILKFVDGNDDNDDDNGDAG